MTRMLRHGNYGLNAMAKSLSQKQTINQSRQRETRTIYSIHWGRRAQVKTIKGRAVMARWYKIHKEVI